MKVATVQRAQCRGSGFCVALCKPIPDTLCSSGSSWILVPRLSLSPQYCAGLLMATLGLSPAAISWRCASRRSSHQNSPGCTSAASKRLHPTARLCVATLSRSFPKAEYMGSISWLAPHMDRLLGTSLCFTLPSSALESWSRRLRARRKPAPLLLEARPGLPALLAAPGGAQGRQALLLQSPSGGLSERPCRASGCLLIRPAAQQLLGKVGLLHTAAATDAEQRAASATASEKCDRAMPGRAGLSTRSALPGSPALHLCRSSLHLPRSQHGRGHDMAFHSELRDALFASSLPFVLSVNDVPEAWELSSSARARMVPSPSCLCCIGAILRWRQD